MSTSNDIIAPPGLTLDEVVAYWAKRRGSEPVLELESGSPPLTWGEFEGYIQGVAEGLSGAVRKGDSVAVVCSDGADYHVLVNALWRCGAAILLVNRTWGAAVVADLLHLTDCTTVFAKDWPTQVDAAGVLRADYPALRHPDRPGEPAGNDPDAVAMYATTSGTTDDPKCVKITHRKIRSAYRACFSVHDFRRVRRAASLFPLNGIGVMGVCFLLPREIGAGTRVFPPFSMANVQQSWKKMLHEGVDFVYMVPPLVRLLNVLPAIPGDDARLLAFCAAAPVQYNELRTLEKKFPVRVFNAYGLTEMTFAVFFGCRDHDGLASDSIGYPVGIEARIVDEDGVEITGAGCGELYLTGPMLTDGYTRNPAATAETWENGWLKTGDVAQRDAHGRYFIRGRLKDTVVRGGILYYYHELEHYLRRAPGVIDACAFKGRDLPSGDELCVMVHVGEPTPPAELMKWIKDHVGAEKVPNVLFTSTEALPRNSNGKVVRQSLVERYLAGELE